LRPFLIALQFLTLLPIRIGGPPDNKSTGQSILYYPLVGLVIGSLTALLFWGLESAPALLAAALLLSFWTLATGALHLDGLADSADAWIGGFGDREKTLAIMKDPCCGPAAVVTVVLVLLIKFTALVTLIEVQSWEFLLLTPMLSRSLLILLFLTTPYVRQNGLGDQLAKHLPRQASLLVTVFVLFGTFILIGSAIFWLLIVTAGTFIALRYLMIKRIGGITGDTAGALVEISEAALLVTAALIIQFP